MNFTPAFFRLRLKDLEPMLPRGRAFFNFRHSRGVIKREGLKAHYRDADWISNTMKKKGIRHDSVISLYSEIHEDGNDLIPLIPETETKYDPRT